MKTTLKKTMAALSAAAVVAASAAVMAVPTSAAADITLGISSKEVTLDELAASGNKVTLDITSSAEFNSCGVGVTLNDGLEYDEDEGMYPTVKKGQGSAVSNGNFVFMPFAYAPVPLKTLEAGKFAEIVVKVPSTAKVGDKFTVSISGKDSDGKDMPVKNGVTGDVGTASGSTGTITIVGEPEPETTTAAPTATPTAGTTTTAAPVATKTNTNKRGAKSTSSPNTGDALPVAGVAVAVAVIGGVALVAKKRK